MKTFFIGYNASCPIKAETQEEALEKFEMEVDYSEIEFVQCYDEDDNFEYEEEMK